MPHRHAVLLYLASLIFTGCAEEPTRAPEQSQAANAVAADAAGPRCFGGRPVVLTDLGTPNLYSEPLAINNRGQVAGTAVVPDTTGWWPDADVVHVVLWTLLSGPTPVHELRTIRALMTETQALVQRGRLTSAQARSLVLVLERAHTQLETKHRLAAVTRLREYVSGVRALMSKGQLPRADGQPQIDAATCAIDRLS